MWYDRNMKTKIQATIAPPTERTIELSLTLPENMARVLRDLTGNMSVIDEQKFAPSADKEFHVEVMSGIFSALDTLGV
jgi:hypothetical protein